MLYISIFIAGLVISLFLVSLSQSFQHMYALASQDARSWDRSELRTLYPATFPAAIDRDGPFAAIVSDGAFPHGPATLPEPDPVNLLNANA